VSDRSVFDLGSPRPGSFVPLEELRSPVRGVRAIAGGVLLSTALALGPDDPDHEAIGRAPHPVVEVVDSVADIDELVWSVASGS